MEHNFEFSNIFPYDVQKQTVFEAICIPAVELVLTKANGCCLVYGQQGAGKTQTVFGEDGLVELTLRRLFVEIKNEEKGIKAAVACIDVKDNYALDLLRPNVSPDASPNCEMKGNMGLFGVPETTWIPIHSVTEPLAALRQGKNQRNSQVADARVHTFVLFTVSRANDSVNPISSLIIGDLGYSGTAYSDSLALLSTDVVPNSVVILEKLFSELCSEKSHLISKSMHGDWFLSLLAVLLPSPESYDSTLNVLNYASKIQSLPHSLTRLRRIQRIPTTLDDKRIIQLRRDIEEAISSLQQQDFVHSKQLKDLGAKFGLEFDLNLLKDAELGTREMRIVKSIREAMERMDTMKKRKIFLEKRNEDQERKINEAKSENSRRQQKRNAELEEYQDQLFELRKVLEDLELPAVPSSKNVELEALQSSSAQNNDLDSAHSSSLMNLRAIAVTRSEQADTETEERKSSRDELEVQFRHIYKQQESDSKKLIGALEQKYKDALDVKAKEMKEVELNLRTCGIRKNEKVRKIILECTGLCSIVQSQQNLIEAVKRGDFNRGITPVVIPLGHQPHIPDEIINK